MQCVNKFKYYIQDGSRVIQSIPSFWEGNMKSQNDWHHRRYLPRVLRMSLVYLESVGFFENNTLLFLIFKKWWISSITYGNICGDAARCLNPCFLYWTELIAWERSPKSFCVILCLTLLYSQQQITFCVSSPATIPPQHQSIRRKRDSDHMISLSPLVVGGNRSYSPSFISIT